MSRPFPPRSSSSSGPFVRVNGKIRAREVRVVGLDGKQLGVIALGEALNIARASGVDLVEVAPNAVPPVVEAKDPIGLVPPAPEGAWIRVVASAAEETGVARVIGESPEVLL